MIHERLTFGHARHRVAPARTRQRPAVEASAPGSVAVSYVERFDWAWGGLLIFTVFLFFRPQEQLTVLRAAHLGDLAALLGLSAMVFLNLSRGRAPTRMTPELAGVLLLGAIILATVPTSFWMGGVVAQFLEVYLPIALIFMLMVNTINSPRRVERLSNLIVIAFGYVSLLVLFNYARGVNLMEGRAMGPFNGFFQNPNDLALNLAAFLPLAMINVRRPGPWSWRLLCAGISAMMLVVVVLTQSRSGAIGAAAMLLTFAVVARLINPVTILAAVLVGMVALPLAPDTFWTRMASITDPSKDTTGSRAERKLLLDQAVTVFLDNPLTGVGMGQFQNYYDPGLRTRWHETHNVLLQIGTELGILGVAAFVFLVWRAFSAAWWTRAQLSWIHRKRRRHKDAVSALPGDGLTDQERTFLQTHGAAMMACVAGWFFCAMFASVGYNWTFYYVLGLSVAGRDAARERARTYAQALARAGRDSAAA